MPSGRPQNYTTLTDVTLPSLNADQRLFRQILLNLLSNAIKFTPKDGQITVRGLLAEDGWLRIEVEDTGIGMKASDIPRALEAFSQVQNRLSKTHQGTGLGLHLVKTFMELHDGTIDIDSELGVGTVVGVAFPPERVRHRQSAAEGRGEDGIRRA
jgi:two-component system cell cycle sensor histidine kinase PleC